MKKMLTIATTVALLSACATPAPDRLEPLALNTPMTLQPAQSARLPDSKVLTYLRTDNDSRCRPDVVCVWAGKADVHFMLDTREFTVELPRQNGYQLGRYKLTIENVPFTKNPPVTVRITTAQ